MNPQVPPCATALPWGSPVGTSGFSQGQSCESCEVAFIVPGPFSQTRLASAIGGLCKPASQGLGS